MSLYIRCIGISSGVCLAGGNSNSWCSRSGSPRPRGCSRVYIRRSGISARSAIKFPFYLRRFLDSLYVSPDLNDTDSLRCRVFKALGFLINVDKSELVPSRDRTFIGVRFNTTLMRAFPPQDRWEKICVAIPAFLAQDQQSAIRLASLLGLLMSMQDVTHYGRLILRPVQRHLNLFWYDRFLNPVIPVSAEARAILRWWLVESNVMTGVSLLQFAPDHLLFTDGSLQGWGAHCSELSSSGLWTINESRLHINVLEFQVV